MTSGVVIRPLRVEDAPVIETMSREFAAYLMALDPSEDEVPPITAAAIRDNAFGPDPCISGLIAESAGEPAGYLLYSIAFWADDVAPALWMPDLFVREALRGKGVGRLLMEEAAKIIKARGGKRIIWTVWDKNPKAIAFYKRMGGELNSSELLMTWSG